MTNMLDLQVTVGLRQRFDSLQGWLSMMQGRASMERWYRRHVLRKAVDAKLWEKWTMAKFRFVNIQSSILLDVYYED